MTLEFYLLIFFFNLFIELGIAFLLGYRSKELLPAIFAVNLFTHPLLTYILLVLASIKIQQTLLILICLEIFVVLAEARLLEYAFEGKKFLKLAFAMNATSFLIGLIIFP